MPDKTPADLPKLKFTMHITILVVHHLFYVCFICMFTRMAENGFAPPLGNFADIFFLVEN